MATKTNKNRKEEIIQDIKDCGQSLIDNAEKIANDYKYERIGLTITCYVNEADTFPYIKVSQSFIPENHIDSRI